MKEILKIVLANLVVGRISGRVLVGAQSASVVVVSSGSVGSVVVPPPQTLGESFTGKAPA